MEELLFFHESFSKPHCGNTGTEENNQTCGSEMKRNLHLYLSTSFDDLFSLFSFKTTDKIFNLYSHIFGTYSLLIGFKLFFFSK